MEWPCTRLLNNLAGVTFCAVTRLLRGRIKAPAHRLMTDFDRKAVAAPVPTPRRRIWCQASDARRRLCLASAHNAWICVLEPAIFHAEIAYSAPTQRLGKVVSLAFHCLHTAVVIVHVLYAFNNAVDATKTRRKHRSCTERLRSVMRPIPAIDARPSM